MKSCSNHALLTKHLEKMKQVVLRIDDAAFEKFMGMVDLCPMVEVLNVCGTGDKKLTIDAYVSSAIREMRQALAFKNPCDYAYLMVAMNESVVKGKYPDWTFTDSPKASEALRRKNLVKRFLSAFMRAQSNKSDGWSDEE